MTTITIKKIICIISCDNNKKILNKSVLWFIYFHFIVFIIKSLILVINDHVSKKYVKIIEKLKKQKNLIDF